jgi:Fe/S biogenesis protein NfuA
MVQGWHCRRPNSKRSPQQHGGNLFDVSPLAAEAARTDASLIITITDEALHELLALRDAEPEGDRLGLRLEIVSNPGEDFKYDLSFDVVTKAAFSDEVRTHSRPEFGSLKVIMPAAAIDLLEGATLDHTATQGLVIRNPNKPKAPSIEGLVSNDALSAEVETLIKTEVNPALAAHGGFVTYVGHDGEGTAYLTMGGGCHGCSMSRMTMLDGVQTMLVEQLPQIERVRDLTDHASGENPYYH